MRISDKMGLTQNIGIKERITSVLSGSYLLYDSLSGKRKSVTKALTGGYMVFRGATGYCPFNRAIGIKNVDDQNDINLNANLIISKPREQVYDYWRNLENLPQFMHHLEKVEEIDEKNSEWTAKIPGGMGKISWRSVITEDIPNELIQWESLPGSSVDNAGTVRFTDAGEVETEVQVHITYSAPMGVPGNRIANLLNPLFEGIVKEDVRDFKQILETSESPVVNGHHS